MIKGKGIVPSEILSGAGLGLLVGLLLGLAVSEVVGGVVASLAALLGAYLGLRSGGDATDANLSAARASRTIGFGLLCVAGILLGVAIRANNWLAPTPDQMIERWTAAGYPPKQARELVAYERLGIAADNWNVIRGPGAAAQATSALFGTESLNACSELDPDRYTDGVEWENALRLAGGYWQGLTEAIAELPSGVRVEAMRAAWHLACETD